MNKNIILTTLSIICLLYPQISIAQNIEQQPLYSNSMQSQLDETCNLTTTNRGASTYVFTVMPIEQAPNCTHYFIYFALNSKTNIWTPYLTDSISTAPYIVQVGFTKNVTYRVQHYIVSNENNRRSHIFEADFILKKTLVAKNTTTDRLDMLSQRNIEAIPNTDSNMLVHFSGNNTLKDTPKLRMKH
jgi:hypothetical protein